jgi:hypothetical protein
MSSSLKRLAFAIYMRATPMSAFAARVRTTENNQQDP